MGQVQTQPSAVEVAKNHSTGPIRTTRKTRDSLSLISRPQSPSLRRVDSGPSGNANIAKVECTTPHHYAIRKQQKPKTPASRIFKDLVVQFAEVKTKFEGSEYCHNLTTLITNRSTRGHTDNAILFGLGSLQEDIRRKDERSMYQLIFFLHIVRLLSPELPTPAQPGIKLYAQDPIFSTTDRLFLLSHDIEVLDVDPEEPWSGLPATSLITPQTFIYAPCILHELYARIAGTGDPYLAISHDINLAIKSIDINRPSQGYTLASLSPKSRVAVKREAANNFSGNCGGFPSFTKVSFREEVMAVREKAEEFAENREAVDIPDAGYICRSKDGAFFPFHESKLYVRKFERPSRSFLAK